MTREQIEKTIVELAAEQSHAGEAEISRATTFDELCFDSIDRIEFVMDVEDEFKVAIPDDVVDRIKTIGEAADYVWGKVRIAVCQTKKPISATDSLAAAVRARSQLVKMGFDQKEIELIAKMSERFASLCEQKKIPPRISCGAAVMMLSVHDSLGAINLKEFDG